MDLQRISSCTYAVRDREVAQALQVMADLGLHKVDLWGNQPHFSLMSINCNWEDLRKQAADRRLTIANLGSYPGRAFVAHTHEAREAELLALQATLHAAKALGARSIRVMPGSGEDPDQIDLIAPYFAAAVRTAEQLGVYMGMENHAGSIAGSPTDVKRLCDIVGSPFFGVLYEPANLMAAGVDYKAAFETFSQYIVHIHVKDGATGPDGFRPTHLGEGEIDYRWVIEAMESLEYTGDYALEYEISDIEPLETGLKKWLEYFLSL